MQKHSVLAGLLHSIIFFAGTHAKELEEKKAPFPHYWDSRSWESNGGSEFWQNEKEAISSNSREGSKSTAVPTPEPANRNNRKEIPEVPQK